MAFTSGEMETAWKTNLNNLSESEWVDLVQPATLNYFRFLVTGGTLWKWDRVTGNWNDVTSTIAAVLTAGAITAVTVRIR
jgi:hypothetical protein